MRSSSVALSVLAALTLSLTACGEASKDNKSGNAPAKKTAAEEITRESFECSGKAVYESITEAGTVTNNNLTLIKGKRTTRTVGNVDYITTNSTIETSYTSSDSADVQTRHLSMQAQRQTTKTKLDNGNILEKSVVTGFRKANEGTSLYDKDGQAIEMQALDQSFEQEVKIEGNKRTVVREVVDGEIMPALKEETIITEDGKTRTEKTVLLESEEEKSEDYTIKTISREMTCVYTKE